MGGVVIIATILCRLGFPSPYTIWQNISISWIFIIGHFCSRVKYDEVCSKWHYFIYSIITITGLLLLNFRFGLQTSMLNTQSFLFPFAFISGIIMVNYISHIITTTKIGNIIGYIGDYSFSIMALHFMGFKLVTWGRTLFDNSVNLNAFPTEQYEINLYWPLYLISGIVLPIIVSILFNKLKYAWSNNCCLQKFTTNRRLYK